MGSDRTAISGQFYAIVLVCVLFAVLDGLVLGVLAGLNVHPIQPSRNQAADQDEYIALVSAAYADGQDIDEAMQRLKAIAPDPGASVNLVLAAAQRATARGDTRRAEWIGALADALSTQVSASLAPTPEPPTPTPTPTNTPVIVAELDESTPLPDDSATATSTSTQVPLTNVSAPARPPSSTPTRAARPTSTRTPKPAATLKQIAQPRNTPTPTATRVRLPTATATATATPAVPTPTATPVPTQNSSTPTPTATQTAPRVTPTVTIAPGADYRITLERQLTPCENEGNHNIYVLVLDAQGNGIPGIEVEMVWPSGSTVAYTGQKVEYIPSLGVNSKTTAGYLNFALFKGSYRVHVMGSSVWSDWLTVDIPQDQLCPTNDNPVANSLFHYSYLVDFQKVR